MSLPVLPQDAALTGANAGLWAIAILGELKAPVTLNNVYTFAGWFHNEGGGGQNNPMNSSEGSEYPVLSGNPDDVREYPTPEIGAAETAVTLENGYYPNIVAAFRAGIGLGSPSAAVAAELGTWSGGGYHAIDPITVPMPAAPATYHYEWFTVGRERNAVEAYDKVTTVAKRRAAKPFMAVLKTAVWVAAHAGHPIKPDWTTKRRGWRYQQLSARAAGKVVQPVAGEWPQS